MNSEIMRKLVEPGWFDFLEPFFKSKEFDKIIEFLRKRKAEGINVVPYDDEFLNAFKFSKYKDIKVVILGQDPYYSTHNGQPIANGLAFGTDQVTAPPSLETIKKEVERDIYDGCNLHTFIEDKDNSLKQWAEQGILLLNTALTTELGTPGSHLDLWRPFTNYVLDELNKKNTGLVYLLWGAYAKGYIDKISPITNHCYIAGHPSPKNDKLPFIGCGHFSKTNDIIRKNNGPEYIIKW